MGVHEPRVREMIGSQPATPRRGGPARVAIGGITAAIALIWLLTLPAVGVAFTGPEGALFPLQCRTIDPEFNFDNRTGTYHVTFSVVPPACVNCLRYIPWVGRLDPNTGALLSPCGREQQLATEAVDKPQGQTGPKNGPEFGESLLGKQIFFMVTDPATDQVAVAKSSVDAGGQWTTEIMPGSDGRFLPFATLNENDPDTRVMCSVTMPDGIFPPTEWRFGSASVGTLVTAPNVKDIRPGHWTARQPRFGTVAVDSAGRLQAGIYDVTAGTFEQVSRYRNGESPQEAFEVFADEINQYIVMVRRDDLAMDVFRKRDGKWKRFRIISHSHDGNQFILSPEAFSYRGRTYVHYILAQSRNQDDFKPAEVRVDGLVISYSEVVMRSKGRNLRDPEHIFVNPPAPPFTSPDPNSTVVILATNAVQNSDGSLDFEILRVNWAPNSF